MATINVYEQYFSAQAEYNGVARHGALVMLIADSEAGNIRYEAAVSFFPHNQDDDFAVSYIDELAETVGGKVLWDKPLREERRE